MRHLAPIEKMIVPPRETIYHSKTPVTEDPSLNKVITYNGHFNTEGNKSHESKILESTDYYVEQNIPLQRSS